MAKLTFKSNLNVYRITQPYTPYIYTYQIEFRPIGFWSFLFQRWEKHNLPPSVDAPLLYSEAKRIVNDLIVDDNVKHLNTLLNKTFSSHKPQPKNK